MDNRKNHSEEIKEIQEKEIKKDEMQIDKINNDGAQDNSAKNEDNNKEKTVDEKKLLKKRINKKKKRKRRKKIISFILLIIVVSLIITAYNLFLAPNKCSVNITIDIPEKSSVTQIADELQEKKVISWKYAFMTRAFMSGNHNKLKHGTFTFKEGMSYEEIIDVLCKGGAKKETISVTIPEGYSVEMIINKYVESGIGNVEEFEKALNEEYDYEFLKHITAAPGCKYKLQGFLFPATYDFYTDATAHDVIDDMLAKFEEEYKKTGAPYDDISTVITKAALVEREAKLDSERPIIAGVIENRLNTGMKLCIDASVVYAITNGLYNIDRVLYEHLEIDSEYNTYKYDGLPVGPICNPGIESIKAAQNPTVHEYYYYRTTEAGDGSHRFSKTEEEHLNG